jgi:hypothetical protein
MAVYNCGFEPLGVHGLPIDMFSIAKVDSPTPSCSSFRISK